MDERTAELFAPDYVEAPYWWQAAPVNTDPAEAGTLNHAKADVLVIGSGVTGLAAALILAHGGADVLVLDAGAIGSGACRRNAGFLGRTLKRSIDWLDAHCGAHHAIGVYRELDEALNGIKRLTEKEGIDCHLQSCGRFIAANSPAHLRDLDAMKRKLGFEYFPVDKADQQAELASDCYHGGAVIPDLGALHPGRYHAGLLARAQSAGVRLQAHTQALGIAHDGSHKSVHTTRGTVSASQVVVATNGYTPHRLTWFARRLVPFRGYVMATEVLAPTLINRVLPKRRTYLDTKMNIDFIRPAPDSERILFGGMTGGLQSSATALAPTLYQRMTRILPDLRGVRISRAWTGFCAGTLDFMPHIGSRDGVHFALGYNFAGVPLGTLFGQKLAARILGRPGGASVFDAQRFPALPFSYGAGLLAPLAMRVFDWQDRRLADRGSPADL